MAVTITNKGTKPHTIKGTQCKVGHYYRRESVPEKVYVASRDTSRDVREWVGNQHALVREGVMLVSLAHGNRMTANMGDKDFIEVDVTIEYVDTK